jgi:HSP20 family protein
MLIWRARLIPGSAFHEEETDLATDWLPDLDVFELPREFLFILSLPGVRPEDVEVGVAGRTLVVVGSRPPAVAEGAVAHLIESGRGRFQRRLRLPVNADAAAVRREMAHGQLLLRVPKSNTGGMADVNMRGSR